MGALLYIRLIGYTAGTLLQLFWMVVILGYRRQRNFERVFFFLCLAFFFFYSGSLLALNSQIYYPLPPAALNEFAIRAPDKPQRYFHWTLLVVFVASFLAVAGLHVAPFHAEARTAEEFATAFSLLPILPFSVLIFLVYRHNFLQIGRQKNLLYAISVPFLALLYLRFVLRLGLRLAPVLPPAAY